MVDSAEAVGLPLVAVNERDPLRTTTRGLGELLLAILAEHPREVLVGIGGTATVDGGVGMRAILGTFAFHARDGLIPNLFPEGEREGLYHTADATLWFFHAIDRYEHHTGDRTLVRELLPTLVGIAQSHLAGTRFGIRVDRDTEREGLDLAIHGETVA